MVKSARIQSRRQARILRSKLKAHRTKNCCDDKETVPNKPITMRQIDFSNFKLSNSTTTVMGEIIPFSVPHSKPDLTLEKFKQITIEECRSQADDITTIASTYATSNNTVKYVPKLETEKGINLNIGHKQDQNYAPPPQLEMDIEQDNLISSTDLEEEAMAAAVIRRTMKKDPKLRAYIVKLMRKYGYYKMPGVCIKHMNTLMPTFHYNKGVISASMDNAQKTYPNIIDHYCNTPLRVDESVMNLELRPADYHIAENESERLTSVDRIKRRILLPNISFSSRTIVVLQRRKRKHTVIAFNRSLLLDSFYQLDRFFDNKPIFWAMNNCSFDIITSHCSNNFELISEVGAIIRGLTPETLSDKQLIDIWTCIPTENVIVGRLHPKSALNLPNRKYTTTQVMRYERFAISTAEMPADLAFMLVDNIEETEFLINQAEPHEYVCNKAILKKAFAGLYSHYRKLEYIDLKEYILPLIVILAVERPIIFDATYLYDIIQKSNSTPPEIQFRNPYLDKTINPNHRSEFIEFASLFYYKIRYNPDSMFKFMPEIPSKYRKEEAIYLDRSYMLATTQRFIKFVKESRKERTKLAHMEVKKKIKKPEPLKLTCRMLGPEEPYAYIVNDAPFDINGSHPIALYMSEINDLVKMKYDYYIVDKIDCKGLVYKPYIRNVLETSEFRLPYKLVDVLSILFANKKAGSNKFMTKTNSFVLGEFKEYILTMRRYRYLYNTTSTAGSSSLVLDENKIRIEDGRVCIEGVHAYMSSEFYTYTTSQPISDTVHVRVCNYLCSRLYILLYHINFPHYFDDQAVGGYSRGSSLFTDFSKVKGYLDKKIYKGNRLDRHSWNLYLDSDIKSLKSVVFKGDYTIESMPIFDITDDPNDDENIFYYPVIETEMNEEPLEYKSILERVMKEEYINQQFHKQTRIKSINHKMTLNRLYYLLHISRCQHELNTRCRYLLDPMKRKFTVQYSMHKKDYEYMSNMKKAYNASCYKNNPGAVSEVLNHDFTHFIISTDIGNLETKRHITPEEFIMLRQDYQRILLFTINTTLEIYKKNTPKRQKKLLRKIDNFEWSFWLMNRRVREDTIEYLKDKHWRMYVKERLKIIDEKCIEYYLYLKNKKLKSGARWTADSLIQAIRQKSYVHLTRDYDWEFYDAYPRLIEEVKKLYDEKVKFMNEYYLLAEKYAKGNPKAYMGVWSYKNLLKYAKRTLRIKPFKITEEEVISYLAKKGYNTAKYEEKSKLYLRSLYDPDTFFMRGVFIHKTVPSANRFINVILSESLSIRRFARDTITPEFKLLTGNPFRSALDKTVDEDSLDPNRPFTGKIDVRKGEPEPVVVYNEDETSMLDCTAQTIQQDLSEFLDISEELLTPKRFNINLP